MSQTIPDIDPATLANMFHATAAALPVAPDASAEDLDAQRQAALLAVTARLPARPRGSDARSPHRLRPPAPPWSVRRAARHDIDDNAALRLQGKAVSLANLAMRTLRELRKRQAEPPACIRSRESAQAGPRTAGRDRAGRLEKAPTQAVTLPFQPHSQMHHVPRSSTTRLPSRTVLRWRRCCLIDTCGSSTANCAMPLFCQCCADAHMIRLARINIARF